MIVFDHSHDGELWFCDDSKVRFETAYADIPFVHDVCAFSQVSYDASDQRIRELFDRGGHRTLTEHGNAAETAAIRAGVNKRQVDEWVSRLADLDCF